MSRKRDSLEFRAVDFVPYLGNISFFQRNRDKLDERMDRISFALYGAYQAISSLVGSAGVVAGISCGYSIFQSY